MWRRIVDHWRAWFGPDGGASGWLAGKLGNAGERVAERYLKHQGFRILFRRYRTPLGEIDLIARDQDTIVFVEVKTRRGDSAGNPESAVDERKQAQITRLALAFLKQNGLLEHPARFDVVAIVWPAADDKVEITHYRHAFDAHGRGQLHS